MCALPDARAVIQHKDLVGVLQAGSALVRRCRWPPERFLPPCATSAFSPPSRVETNSAACEVSSAT